MQYRNSQSEEPGFEFLFGIFDASVHSDVYKSLHTCYGGGTFQQIHFVQ